MAECIISRASAVMSGAGGNAKHRFAGQQSTGHWPEQGDDQRSVPEGSLLISISI